MSSEGLIVTVGPIYSQISRLNTYLNNEQLAARIVGKRIFQTSAGMERKGKLASRKHKNQIEASLIAASLETTVIEAMQTGDEFKDKGLILTELSELAFTNSASNLWPIFKYYFQRNGYVFRSARFFEEFGIETSKGIMSNPPLSNARVTVDLYHEDKFRNKLFHVLTNEYDIIRCAAEKTVHRY